MMLEMEIIECFLQITVAIIGNETLDTLQEWAEEIFTSIPNKEKTKPGQYIEAQFLCDCRIWAQF